MTTNPVSKPCDVCLAPATQYAMPTHKVGVLCDPCAEAKAKRTARRLALKASGMTNAEVVASCKKV